MTNVPSATAIEERTGNPLTWRVYVAISLAVVCIWLAFPKNSSVFPLDDTYIHLTYAKNLANTGAWVFNAGESSLGTSSPLWVLILSFPFLIGLNIYWSVQLIGLFLLCSVACLSAKLIHFDCKKSDVDGQTAVFAATFAGLLIALNGNLHWFSLSGMETLLFVLLGLAAVVAWQERGFDSIAGLFCGLLLMTRLPGALLTAVLFIADLVKGRRPRFSGVLIVLLCLTVYSGLSYKTSGRLLPVTARAKRLTYVDGGFSPPKMKRYLLAPSTLFNKLLEGRVVQPLQRASGDTDFRFDRSISTTELLVARCIKAGVTKQEELDSIISAWRAQRAWRPLWFLWAMCLYQRFLPQNVILFFLILLSLLLGKFTKNLSSSSVVLTWGIAHIAVYSFLFRTLHHHSRYFANIHVALVIAGVWTIVCLSENYGRIIMSVLCVLLVFCGIVSIPPWCKLYENNVQHINKVYVPMAYWIKENTPRDARIASFDIGVLGYLSQRYLIDLGGLVDPRVHPYLKDRFCAPYIKKARASHILYARNMDVDVFTRVSPSLNKKNALMKERGEVVFSTNQYEAPTVTQAFMLELVSLEWLDYGAEGLKEYFSPKNPILVPMAQNAGFNLQFLGSTVDQRSVEVIPHYAYSVRIALSFRANKPPSYLPWLNLAFFKEDGELAFHYSRRLTDGVLVPRYFPLDAEVQDNHQYFLPTHRGIGKFRVKFCFTGRRQLEMKNHSYLKWIDLGDFEMKRNVLIPHDHLQWIHQSK